MGLLSDLSKSNEELADCLSDLGGWGLTTSVFYDSDNLLGKGGRSLCPSN